MSESGRFLLLTDVVDSTLHTQRLGDSKAAVLWAEHDRMARDLLQSWRGLEIDKSDGFLLLFEQAADALGYASAYHGMLASLSPPLQARAGVHYGLLQVRHNPADHIALGAKALEVDGAAKPTAARIMALARPSQTLVSAAARAGATSDRGSALLPLGHWRLKGLDEPIEIFEDAFRSPYTSQLPDDSDKAWRVAKQGELWLPVRTVPHSLPAERDHFIGRLADLRELSRHLDNGARLVTLLGAGGIGKTRLALRHGWLQQGAYAGGIWFCDLSAARSLDGVLHAMALGLQSPLPGADPVSHIGDALAGRGDCLVIVDNFEQVVRHAEPTLGRWLAQAPNVRFIVTSREVLGIQGEQAMDLPVLTANEGAALLRERAGLAGAPSFLAEDEAAVPELVRMLDSLPLAIELAASRMRLLPPSKLLMRMGQRFQWLASRQGRQDRQATLRATLDWSWDMLSEAEQSTLMQLSVFDAGISLPAAEAVVQLEPRQQGRAPVADLVQSLLDKSLLRRGSGARLDMLRGVQDYANQRLVALAVEPNTVTSGSPLQDARARHWHHFATYGEAEVVAERGADTDNLVSACQRAIAAQDWSSAARCLIAAWHAIKLVGPFSSATRLAHALDQALPSDSPWRSHAQWVAGSAWQHLGDLGKARELLRQALSTEDPWLAVNVHTALSSVELTAGHLRDAETMLQHALRLSRQLGDKRMQCMCLNAIGTMYSEQSEWASALRWYEEALVLTREMGDRRWEGGLLGNMGVSHHSLGHLAEARNCYEAALQCAEDSGDRRWEGNTRSNLGMLYQELGQTARAREQFQSARTIAHHLGHVRLARHVTCNLGLLEEASGELELARNYTAQAVEAAQQSNDQRDEVLFRCYLVRLDARLGRLGESSASLQRAESLHADMHNDLIFGLLRCAAAELALVSGQPDSARRLTRDAREAFVRSAAENDSELGRELTRVEGMLSSDVSRD